MQHGGGYNIEPYLAIQYLEQSAAYRCNTLESVDNNKSNCVSIPWDKFPNVSIKQIDILFVSVDYQMILQD